MIGRFFAHPAVRLCLVAALILLIYFGAGRMQAALNPPDVDWPAWTFHDMPKQLGDWHGEDVKGDPEVIRASGADVTVNRQYQDDAGHQVTTYAAMFKDPATGVYHSPMYCYRNNGWELQRESKEELAVSDNLTIPVWLSVWERKGEKIIILFWYQLGEHVMFKRGDLDMNVRRALSGRPKWPVLLKLMMQIHVSDPKETEATVLDFAKLVAQWLNQPERRNGKGMLGTAQDAPVRGPSGS